MQNQALRINDRFNSQFKDALHKGQSQSVSTVQGSLLGYDWSDGDIVFANSTCFDDSLMSAIAKQAELLLPGSMFVTFTKALPSGCFEIIDKKRYKMSWGPATVFIQRRLADDGTALPAYRLNILPSDDIEYSDLDDQEDEEEDEEEDEVIVKPCLPMSIHKTDKNLSKNIESLPKPPPSRFVLNSPADSALLSRKRSPRAL